MYREITACRICGNSDMVEILDLGIQALTGVFPKTKGQQITSGPLRLLKCVGGEGTCGLVQLQHTYDLGELYGDNYGYRSGLNPAMVSHLHSMVNRILPMATLRRDSLIIDIGANDGTTLRAFPEDGCTLVGIDPTGEKFRDYYPPHVQLIPEFFSAETVRRHCGSRKASVITSFSMLYDLEEPLRFVREVREVLDDDGIWAFEQSYMPTMLKRNSYDTVCHEHLEYYSLKQIMWLLDRADMKVLEVNFNDTNGGSFCVVAGTKSSHREESSRVRETLDYEMCLGLESLKPFHEFAVRVSESKTALREFLESSRTAGKSINGLGASTKGNVLLQYCNISSSEVEKIGEVNRDKFGSYTPGTLLPIVSEEEVLTDEPDYLLVLPWHFKGFFESQARLRGRNLIFPLPGLEVVTM